MRTMKKHLILSVSYGLLAILTPGQSRGAERQFLQHHVPAVVSKLTPGGNLPASNTLALAIGLPLRNTHELAALVKEIYDPVSAQYRQYLTPDQFTARFAPTEQDYQAVRAYAEANGLKVTATHPNRMVLDVRAAVGDIEKAL